MPETYFSTSRDDINRRFDYHPPSPEVGQQHADVRWALKDVAIYLLDNLPESREASLAITKLEEALFWANAAIARNQPKPEGEITVKTISARNISPGEIPPEFLARLSDLDKAGLMTDPDARPRKSS